MSQKVLFIKLLLVHYATQGLTHIHADCNDNVSLDCQGAEIGNRKFLAVTWYKLSYAKKIGIIRKSKDDESSQTYNFTLKRNNEEISFGEKYSLFLPSVTPEDSGTYMCAISANIGGQNQDLTVNLTVNACVTQADLTTMTNALNTTQDSERLCHEHILDLPVMWTIIGYVAVGLAKIILSLFCVWVNKFCLHSRHYRL
ncbi:hypothetical protein PAMA_021394 [Pampus argenteus]